ncbi:multidrug efflux pump subunit AcrA (membrane-fusion protein) [Halomonas campaniensis]|uniref:Multidrug efflux pump subunit AcrA (Membrane-fusion protein) n=2 Tax=Halomonas campaniensis TaxID=213554 RepID=A0A7W5P9G9_9GAMM|nr:multidrug efflux pump subunit AcrA (membrane-fusion protein) [Halomonas campaniensis]
MMEGSAARRHPDVPGHDRIAFLDQALWKRLADAQDEPAYLQAWLSLQSRMIPGCRSMVVLFHEVEDALLVPVAAWPDASPPAESLSAAVDAAVASAAGAARRIDTDAGGESRFALALPVFLESRLDAVVALEVAGADKEGLPELMRRLQWGVAWLETLLWRRRAEQEAQQRERVEAAFDLLAPVLDARHLRDACDSLASELAARLNAVRVAVGLNRGGRLRVAALSHTAVADNRMQAMRLLAAAMHEALDQDATLMHPAPPGQVFSTLAHARLLEQSGSAAVVSVPLAWGDQRIGVILVELAERDRMDDHLLDTLEAVAASAAPVLDARRRSDRWLVGRGWDSLVDGAGALFGPRYLGKKLVAVLLAALVAYLSLATGQFRITSDALIEGSVQRTLAAPFDGYLAEASVRPGDIVSAGQVLAELDATDRQLELLHWLSMERQRQLEYERALAEGDRSAVAVAAAQAEQARAQADLAREQVRRSRLVAPFDAYVLSGDLSRSIGAAMSGGEPMLELAPLDAYRVVVRVDERDIGHLAEQQRGQLVLAALPEQALAFQVERITSVSEPGDGQNRFRVEGVLEDPEALQRLRPGMEGVAKVSVDERRLAWIWSYRIVDWFRLQLWRWWP